MKLVSLKRFWISPWPKVRKSVPSNGRQVYIHRLKIGGGGIKGISSWIGTAKHVEGGTKDRLHSMAMKQPANVTSTCAQ